MEITPKQKKIAITVLVVILIAAGVFFFMKKRKKGKSTDPFASLIDGEKASGEEVTKPTGKTEEQLIQEVKDDSSFPLKMGKQGKRVEQAQRYLVDKKGAALSSHGIDGIWGVETEAAMQSKLNRNNISADYFITSKMYLEPVSS